MSDRQTKLYQQWYHGCKTEEDKNKRYDEIISNSGSLTILKIIVEKELKSLQDQAFSEKSFENESWSQKQAHILGQIKTYSNLLMLLKFLD